MDESFNGFAAKVVPYLNVMTRIEGHPDDDLMTEKGYRGHPTLAFLDADGVVLGRPLARTVKSFEETLQAIGDLAKLDAREAKGEKGLEYERFLLEYLVMKLRGANLTKRGLALKGLDETRQARVDEIVLGVEVDALVLQSLGDAEALAKAGRRMLEILESGRCPKMEESANAWSILARHGEAVEDAALIERCAAGLRKNFPDEERMTSWASSLEKKAAAIRAR